LTSDTADVLRRSADVFMFVLRSNWSCSDDCGLSPLCDTCTRSAASSRLKFSTRAVCKEDETCSSTSSEDSQSEDTRRRIRRLLLRLQRGETLGDLARTRSDLHLERIDWFSNSGAHDREVAVERLESLVSLLLEADSSCNSLTRSSADT
jgi:hypothetical protein